MASTKALKSTPTQIIVGPFVYQVHFDEEEAYDYHFLGVCLPRSKQFKLDPLQADTELPQTLLHEVLHALGHAYGIDEWKLHHTDEEQGREDKIDLMATVLLSFLRENPKVVKWLVDNQ